jgi:hypothetical protein
MSKKIIMLALAAASVAAFALPATAMAEDVPLHVVPAPVGAKTIDGEGHATLTSTIFGTENVTCTASSGTATFTTSTTGTLQQKFTGCTQGSAKCTTSGQPEETITTQTLEFHLLTVEDTATHATGPGVLVTPSAKNGFATFTCGFITTTVGGNGLVGTIKSPKCGEESNEATIEFSSSSKGVQTHKTVVGTETEYSLEAFGGKSSEDASGILTLGESALLECT